MVIENIRAWRKQQRDALIARREALSPSQRIQWGALISDNLESCLMQVSGMVVGFYWPYKGEFDVRLLMRQFLYEGGVAALPSVSKDDETLAFHLWMPHTNMQVGEFGIVVPVNSPQIDPRVLIIPVVGFDEQAYRLGYGGGYFDRTLNAAKPRPVTIGVGFEMTRVPTIKPQRYDVPMDLIITEAGILISNEGKLISLTVKEAGEYLHQILSRYGPSSQKFSTFANYYNVASNDGLFSSPCYLDQIPAEHADSPQEDKYLLHLLTMLLVVTEEINWLCQIMSYDRRELSKILINAIGADAKENSTWLLKMISNLEHTATGSILSDIKLAIPVGSAARWRKLMQCEQWIANKIDQDLPTIGRHGISESLRTMSETRLRYVELIDALMERLIEKS